MVEKKPVKKVVFTQEDLNRLIKKGQEEKDRIEKITPLKDDSIFICNRAIMIKSPFLQRYEEKVLEHYNKVLKKIKPANYKD